MLKIMPLRKNSMKLSVILTVNDIQPVKHKYKCSSHPNCEHRHSIFNNYNYILKSGNIADPIVILITQVVQQHLRPNQINPHLDMHSIRGDIADLRGA